MVELLIPNSDLAAVKRFVCLGIASDEQMAAVGVENVIAIKSDPDNIIVRSSANGSTEAGDRRRRFIASDETPDRVGDIIRVAGWDLKAFRKNPVALWAHNDYGFPIGNVVEMSKADGPALVETIEYFSADVSPEADAVYRLVQAGGIRAVSVGFRPLVAKRPESAEERSAMGLGVYGVEYVKQEQLELSNCSIPCNPNALAFEKALSDLVDRGDIAEALAKSVRERLIGGQRTVFRGISLEPKEPDDADPGDEHAELEARIAALEAKYLELSERIAVPVPKSEQEHIDALVQSMTKNLFK